MRSGGGKLRFWLDRGFTRAARRGLCAAVVLVASGAVLPRPAAAAEPVDFIEIVGPSGVVAPGGVATISAKAWDVNFDPVSGVTITFQILRDTDGDSVPDTDLGFADSDVTGDNLDDDGDPVAEDLGEATFDYVGPLSSADDTVLACVDTDADGCASLNGGGYEVDPDDGFIYGATRVTWGVPTPTYVNVSADPSFPIAGGIVTVVASVADQVGNPMSGTHVTFQVLRDEDGDFFLDTDPGITGSDTTGDGVDDDGDPVTEAPDEATFDYTGPASAANDYIFACPDADADGCATLNGLGGFIEDPDEGLAVEWFPITWLDPVGGITLAPQSQTELVLQRANVTGSIEDAGGNPLDNVDLYVEIYRDLDQDGRFDEGLHDSAFERPGDGFSSIGGAVVTEAPGEAILDYAGPSQPATDTIVLCQDLAFDGCASVDGSGQVVPDPADVHDVATVAWIDPDTDGDGVTDSQDPCPLQVGPVSNFGCPVVSGPNGPVVLAGIDAEDGGPGGHGPIDNYIKLAKSILAKVGNGNSAFLVIGAGKNSFDDVTVMWDAVAAGTGRAVTYVNGPSDISNQSFSGFAMIAVASSVHETPSGGLTDEENAALIARSTDVATFVNIGGGLLGFSQTGLSAPWAYVASIGAFEQNTGLGYDNVNPTPDGETVGITDALDICCWHDEFTAWPDWLQVLAYNAQSAEDPLGAAALGGSSVTVAPQTLTVSKDGSGSGTVSSNPVGVDCGGVCIADFGLGQVVSLTASADPGSTFTGWGGDGAACGSNPSCDVTMDAARNVTATFTLIPAEMFDLTVSVQGTGTGTVSSTPAGIDCGADCSQTYDEGTLVSLTASADPGSTFTGWGGDGAACGSNPSCDVTMDAARNVTATFTLIPAEMFDLTVSVQGTGTGTVSSTPAGIDCGADCSQTYDEGTLVSLTASADPGSTFTGWGGDGAACGSNPSCDVTMDAARNVTATFTLIPAEMFDLTVSVQGTGTGTVSSTPAGIDCGADCSQTYDEGTLVSLTASADPGSTFTGWGGDGAACGSNPSCDVTMDAARNVTATFTLIPAEMFDLTVSVQGTGTGTVSSTPAGIDCGADCSQTYDEGTLVSLTASADPGSTFTGWGGDGAACGSNPSCDVTMDAARNVTATFTLNTEPGCTRTIAYWKNHPDEVAALLPIWLGTPAGQHSVEVDATAQAERILRKANTLNGILRLRAQLLGVKLNLASGADASTVSAVIEDADAFLATYDSSDWQLLPKIVKQEVNGWADDLDDFNSGVVGPGEC